MKCFVYSVRGRNRKISAFFLLSFIFSLYLCMLEACEAAHARPLMQASWPSLNRRLVSPQTVNQQTTTDNSKDNIDYGNVSITSPRREPRFEGEAGLQDAYGRRLCQGTEGCQAQGVRRHQDRGLPRGDGRREARQSDTLRLAKGLL